MDGFSEFSSPEYKNKQSLPLVEVDREEWNKIISKYDPRELQHIKENEISPWYEPDALPKIPPLVLNAGPCSAAYLTSGDGRISIAHFTPDITRHKFLQMTDWEWIKSGKIIIPFPRGRTFIPKQFAEHIKFFKNLHLSVVIPQFMDTKGLPTVANMLIDPEANQVTYGINYQESLKDHVQEYRQLLQG